MADANLTSTIAEHRTLMITLRDDIGRGNHLLSGDHLTTVMGPAVQAGVKEVSVILADLRNNALLGTMTQACADQGAIQVLMAQLIQEAARNAGKAAIKQAHSYVEKEVLETLKNLGAKTTSTVTKIEASAKLLLAGAEAKANIISRKRQEVADRYVKDLALVREKVDLVNKLDRRLNEMTADLSRVSTDLNIESGEMYKQIGQIAQGQKAMENQKTIAIHTLVQHFGDQTNSGQKPELVTLKIPEDMEEGKGKELMANFEIYLNGRVEKFYALMPYLSRMLQDYDHATGACFKPPCIQEKIEDIPEEIRSVYTSQSRTLYVAITAKLSDSVKSLTRATFDYGVDDKQALCMEHDGPNLLFALICMFRPCNVEYTEELESTFVDCHMEFKGADPRAVIKELRGPLQEAPNLQIPIKWNQTGKRIVDRLVHNDHNMKDALKGFKNLEVADKDTTAQLDKLFAAVETQCRRNDKQEGKSSAYSVKTMKRTTTKGAVASAKKEERPPRSGNMNRECRFGDRCNQYPNCGYLHSKPKGTPAPPGKCGGEGCSQKASGSGKTLCTNCFMKVCENGEVQLKDGTTFKLNTKNREHSLKAQVKELKKACAAIKAGEDDKEVSEDEDDEAPVGVGGPACSLKRKRANTAKASDEAAKRVKEFAESLGIELE
jgi:predicted transcriptional regulator